MTNNVATWERLSALMNEVDSIVHEQMPRALDAGRTVYTSGKQRITRDSHGNISIDFRMGVRFDDPHMKK